LFAAESLRRGQRKGRLSTPAFSAAALIPGKVARRHFGLNRWAPDASAGGFVTTPTFD